MNRFICLVVLLVILLMVALPDEIIEVGRPQMQCDVAVGWADEPSSTIKFWAPYDIADGLREFGILGEDGSNCYFLTVDERYDFAEVVRYIESLGR